MFKRLLLPIFLASTVSAHATETQFACQTEESANKIGAVIAQDLVKGDQMVDTLVMQGACSYFGDKLAVYVVHRGATFGTNFKVTVVGLSSKMGETPEMWGLIPTEELYADTI